MNFSKPFLMVSIGKTYETHKYPSPAFNGKAGDPGSVTTPVYLKILMVNSLVNKPVCSKISFSSR